MPLAVQTHSRVNAHVSDPSWFAEKLISQIPALQLLMALGYEYLRPEQALPLRRRRRGSGSAIP